MSWLDKLFAKPSKPSRAGLDSPAPTPLAMDPAARAKRPAPKADAHVPKFFTMAGDKVDRRLTDKFQTVRLKLREAFVPARPVTDPGMFAGRGALLTTIIRAIEDRHLHTIIYGERGIGKTSLLHVLAQRAREARYHVSYVSCGAGADFDETFRAVASQIPLLFHEDYGPTSAEAEKHMTIADLLPESGISPRQASEFCAKVVGTRVLVVLDEFERAQSSEFRRWVGEFLKNLSDRSVRVHLVIAGVAASLDDLLEPGGFMQRNVIAVEMPKMSKAEVQEMVHNGEAISGMTFDAEAVDVLAMACNGLPYIASLLSQQACLNAVADKRLNVTAADVEVGLDGAIGEIKGRLSKRLRDNIGQAVHPGSAEILGPLASLAQASEGRLFVDDLLAAFSEPSLAARARAELENLASKGVVTGSNEGKAGQYFRVSDPNALAYLWLLTVKARLAKPREMAVAEGHAASR